MIILNINKMVNLTESDKRFLKGLVKNAKMKRIRDDAKSLLNNNKKKKRRK